MGLFSGIGSALKGFAGGFAGGLVDSFTGGLVNDYFNRKSQERQYDYSLRMWNKENEYNKPINQMKRFEEAGLNPNLIYGQSNTAGSIGSGPSGTNYHLDGPSAAIQRIYAAKNMKEQNKNLQAQNTLIATQAEVQKEQARKARLEIEFFKKYGYWPGTESGPSIYGKTLKNHIEDSPVYQSVSERVGKGVAFARRVFEGNPEVDVYISQFPSREHAGEVIRQLRLQGFKVHVHK